MRSRSALLVMMLTACGGEVPPFADLPLRDTLLADPRVIAALPETQRARLRERFAAALELVAVDDTRVEGEATDERITAHDVARERDGRDADLVVRLKKDGLSSRGRALGFALPAERASPLVFEQDLAPGTSDTLALETLALSGRAGALVGHVQQGEGPQVKHVARVVGWPAAITREGGTLYVNAAWLVVMAEPMVAPARDVIVPRRDFRLTLETVVSLDTCAAQAVSSCTPCLEDPAACTGDPILADYSSAEDECAALSQDNGIARSVCRAAALQQRPEVLACVRRAELDCFAPSMGSPATRPFWIAFETKSVCLRAFDRCLVNPAYTPQITCDACRTSCSSCVPNCSPSCNTGGCSGTSCKQPSYNCGSSKMCAAVEPEPFSLAPFSGVPLALLPLVYFLRAARRRRDDQ